MSATNSKINSRRKRDEVGLLTAFTTVLWVACLMVGVIGLLLRAPPASDHSPSTTQPTDLMEGDLTPPPPVAPMSAMPEEAAADADAPPALSAAGLSAPAAVGFALPADTSGFGIAGVAVLKPNEFAHVRQLTLGQGEGQQPIPEYPTEAALRDEQGAVVVVFSVGPDGRVISARLRSPSPWPLLNDAALRKIRQSWRFTPGAPRTYQVTIQFQLQQP